MSAPLRSLARLRGCLRARPLRGELSCTAASSARPCRAAALLPPAPPPRLPQGAAPPLPAARPSGAWRTGGRIGGAGGSARFYARMRRRHVMCAVALAARH
jgi:hypothetical protein